MSNTAAAQMVSFSMMINKPGYQAMINRTIQDPARARRFISAITSAVSINPALQECTPHTILSGALLGESLNLSPSPQLGQYYLVPFENRKEGIKNAQFVLGYKGMIQLALRSGQYKRLNVLAVKEGELLHWNPMTEEINLQLISDDALREQTATIGYLAFFEYLNGFQKTIYWSKEKMIAHADRYSAAFSREATTVKTKNGPVTKVSFVDYEAHNYPAKDEWMYSSFWYKDFDGMAHKTMLRQLISKWGIMSIDLHTAFANDDAVLNVNDSGEFIRTEEARPPAALPEPDGELDKHQEASDSPAQSEMQIGLDDV